MKPDPLPARSVPLLRKIPPSDKVYWKLKNPLVWVAVLVAEFTRVLPWIVPPVRTRPALACMVPPPLRSPEKSSDALWVKVLPPNTDRLLEMKNRQVEDSEVSIDWLPDCRTICPSPENVVPAWNA